ncbi:uncharacterized protein LOC132758747 [Ruditapes philippinarum]|uniref:uncharacterized protein LOC132753040 n=1 Tax=Ruditapes philippinarum TaxID=129788 RepID=UPI00295C0B27|nr:uncharacterized protein LOC132753040 [Ruditapes philippinarum]XP_060606429.1 uncharacterized protein LOC132758747 [Ruditapes philippinarum]
MLEDEGNFERADIHVQPPPVDELTDEDSASEDEEVGYNNLSGRQLDQQATATVIRLDGRHVVDSASDSDLETDHSSDSSDTDEYEVPANIAKKTSSKNCTTGSSSASQTTCTSKEEVGK